MCTFALFQANVSTCCLYCSVSSDAQQVVSKLVNDGCGSGEILFFIM